MNIFGAILAFIACIYAGIIRLRSLNERELCLGAVSESLLHIRNYIDRTNDALPELFAVLSHQCTGQSGAFFGLLENETEKIGEKSFVEIWRSAVTTAFPDLEGKEYDALSRLGYILGRSDAHTQVREIYNCESIFNSALVRLRQDLPQRKKLALGLSATVGAFTVILLI